MHPYLYQFNRLNRFLIGGLKHSLKKKIPPQFHPFLQPSALLLLTLIPIYIVVKPISFAPKDVAQFEKASVISGWDYQTNSNNPLRVSAKSSDLGGVINVGYNRSSLSFSLPFTKSEVIQTKANEIIYASATSPISVRYQIEPEKLKEDIILKAPPRSSSFIIPIRAKNAEIQLGPDNKPIIVDDKTKQYLFHIEKPYAVDANGTVTYAAKYRLESIDRKPETIIYPDNPGELTFLGGAKSITESKQYRLVLDVDLAWLHDKNRAYPVTIDPTITHDTTTEFAAGQLNRLKDIGSGSAPILESYYQEFGSDVGTVGLWHFNEASGNALDSSGNSNTGTPTATTVTTGLFGNSRTFADNTTDRIVTTNNIPQQPITFSFWVKRSGAPATTRALIENDTDTAGQVVFSVLMNNAGKLYLEKVRNNIAIDTQVIGSTVVTDGNWHHVAAVLDSANYYLYIDGKLDAYTGSGNATTPAYKPILIGADRNSVTGYRFSCGCSLDEVEVYGRVLSAEEIALTASRRPYSVYTSEPIDLTSIESWTSLRWTGNGFATGDGETATSSATSTLIAQWNFNSTSGTTATNDAGTGTCGGTASNCDFTLNNFASTGSQDAATATGWTSANKRWGAGAIMLSSVATADSLSRADPTSNVLDPNSSDLTIETWVNTYDVSSQILTNNNNNGTSCTNNGYYLGIDASGYAIFYLDTNGATAGCDVQITSTKKINDNNWHHLAATVSRGTLATLYIDGVANNTDVSVTSYSSITVTGVVYMGGSAGGYDGLFDVTRYYTKSLTAAEILSNYNSSRLELQTRVGATSDPNDGTWESWSPTTSEAEIATYDNYLFPTNSTGLVSYWPMDETSGATVNDRTGTNTGTATGTTIDTYGIFDRNRQFNGSSYITVNDSSSLDITGDFSISAWVKRDTGNGYLVSKYSGSGSGGYAVLWGTSGEVYCRTDNGTTSTDSYTPINQLVLNTWVHVAAVRNGTSCRVYINGVDKTSTANTHTTLTANNLALTIGVRSDLAVEYLYGQMDELRIYNTALPAAEVRTLSLEGSTNPNIMRLGTETVVKQAGTGSTRIQPGNLNVDKYTVGLWRLDETGGTGAYLKDLTANANHGTPINTTLVDGVNGKARYISTNAITVPDHTSLKPTNISIEYWIKTSITTDTLTTYKYNASSPNQGYGTIVFGSSQAGKPGCWVGGTAWTLGPSAVNDNKWHHVACTYNGTNVVVYVDGIAGTPQAQTASLSYAIDLGIGWASQAALDEVRISSIARTAEEIAESYRMGRDHRIFKTISSTDLSSSNKIPFSIASDRLGTFSQLSIGESAYANYEPDTNTAGLWHLDEQSGSGAYIKDSTGNGNNGTPTATAFTQGKLGKGTYFNGSTAYLNVANATSLNPTSTISVEAWVNTTGTGTNQAIVGKTTGCATAGYLLWLNQNGVAGAGKPSFWSPTGGWLDAKVAVNDGKWHYIVATNDASTTRIYVDGVLNVSGARSGSLSSTTALQIGGSTTGAGCVGMWYLGSLDEVRISSNVRTADEIRQAYEIGARTHNITIDFKAKLGSGNLITGSSDLGFTVDETPYGSSAAASHLFLGDKIIIKENYDGTEYIAQGTVNAVNNSTGAITVTAWDTGSTFPSGGYTVNATVFKWQREYFDITNPLSTHRDALTRLTYRISDGSIGANVWLDDLRSSTGYLVNPLGSTITSSTGSRYFQYRAILSSNNYAVSSALTSVTMDYIPNYSPSAPTLNSTYQTDKVKTADLTPEFRFSSTDPEDDELIYEIQWDTDASFPAATSKVSDADAGFSNITSPGDTSPFTPGNTITHTIQSNLTNATTYFYRVRTKDTSGSNTWGSWSSIKSLTTDTSLTHNTWYETHADQFSTDTTTDDVSISDANNSVIVNSGSTVIDSMEYSSDANAQTAYVTNAIVASGGTETTSGVYRIHTFNASGSLSVTSGGNVEVLVVGGGGGGGNAGLTGNGGGGAGGLVYNSSFSVAAGNITTTVGGGGGPTANGNDSVFSSITAYGGGAGGYNSDGYSGGCGGGGGAWNTTNYGAAGTQGYAGGDAVSAGVAYGGGGGGGMGAAGTGVWGSDSWHGGAGGDGLSYSISGTATYYSGGGGGASRSSISVSGGQGGGGNGGGNSVAATAGTANTGGGGGAGYSEGKSGGSGIIIVRYPDLTLQSYSEATIKTQGTYSLKGIAKATNSLNKTLIRTIGSPIDLSNKNSVTFDIRSTRTGSNIKVGLHDSGGTTTEITPNIASANTFQEATIDLSGVSNANKDAINQIIITIVNADADNTFYVDDMGTSSPGAGTITSTGITAANIYNALLWYSLTYTDEAGANSTYQILYDNNGTPTLISDTDLPGNSTGLTSASPISLALSTTTYPIIYIRSTLTDDGVDPILYDWGVSLNDHPDTPTLDAPTNTATNQNILPALKTTATDPDSDYLRYKIELCTNVGMTNNCQTFDQTSSQTGWSGQNTQSNTAYTSGAQGTYTLQTALLAGTTYYWHSYAKDPGGTNTWSSAQGSPYSFTTNYAPNIPTLDVPIDTATSQSILPVFKTTATDTESDYLRYKIELCTNVGMTTDCQTFDETSSQTGWSGQNTQSNTAYTSGTQATYTAQTELTPSVTYYWLSYAKDPGSSNTWSQTQATPYSFTVVSPPASPAQCLNIIKNATNTQITLQWQDVATTENNYEIERSVDGAAFTLRSTEVANTTQYLDSVTNGHTYAYRLRSRLTDIESHYVYSTNYCATILLNLQTGKTGVSGLQFQGLQIK